MIRRAGWALVVCGFAVVGLLLAMVLHRAMSNSDRLARAEHEVASLRAGGQTLEAQIRSLGKRPQVTIPDAGPPKLVVGPAGPQGFTGLMGPRGPEGPRGPRGWTGVAGAAGLGGAVGATGATGEPGPVGPVGPAGPKGDKGDVGPQGPAGADGHPGTVTPGTYTCPDGQSVTAIAVAQDGSMSLTCSGPLVP